MSNLYQHTPNPRRSAFSEGRWRAIQAILMVLLTGIALTLASCSGNGLPPEASAVTDTQPVGDGLKVIGYALLGAAVVVVTGKLIRS